MSFIPIFDAVAPVVNKILDFIPDPKQKLEAQQALMKSLMDWDSQQNVINAEEAKSDSVFVAGARPFILWCCGVAFSYKFIIQPFLIFLLIAFGSKFDYRLLPNLDWSEMSTVMLSMLGIGGLRTFEKIKGIS